MTNGGASSLKLKSVEGIKDDQLATALQLLNFLIFRSNSIDTSTDLSLKVSFNWYKAKSLTFASLILLDTKTMKLQQLLP